MTTHSLKLLSSEPNIVKDDVLLITCVRNEQLRIDFFLDFYFNLGVDKALIIDNDSDDDTLDRLFTKRNTYVFTTKQSYAESACGINWINVLLDKYARGHWVLVADADEQFIYPDFDKIKLTNLADYLDSHEFTAIAAPMLDMYSKGAIALTDYQPKEPFLASCNYFDGEGYDFDENGFIARGGPRHRLFWQNRGRNHQSPYLFKIPFFKCKDGLKLEKSTHYIQGVTLSDISGLSLHFKFFQDFIENANIESKRKEHFEDARQYIAYAEVLNESDGLTAFSENSVKLENVEQLIDLGYMKTSVNYKKHLNTQANPFRSIRERIRRFIG